MSSEFRMQDSEDGPPGGGIGITDIYFILFRRKWLLVLGGILGVLAAAAVWKIKQPLFQSEAKLLVKYVLETRESDPLIGNSQVNQVDNGGRSVIGSELEILTSADLAQHVARVIGPARLVPKIEDTNDVAGAAGFILKKLNAEALQQTKIIVLQFQHKDPDVTQLVLKELIDAYLKKHELIHRSLGISDDTLSQQREQLRGGLQDTEDRLKQLKEIAGVHSLEDAKKEKTKLEYSIRQNLLNAQAELAERQAAFEASRQSSARPGQPANPAIAADLPSEKIDEYKLAVEQFNLLTRRPPELAGLTASNALVQAYEAKLLAARARKTMLESNYPALLRLAAPAVPGPALQQPGLDIANLGLLVRSSESKCLALSNQLESIRTELRKIDEVESEVSELERRRSSLQKQLSQVELSLQQAQVNATLGDRRNASISRVQEPSPPYRDFGKLYKTMVMALAGGIAFGIGLAFLMEMLLDRSLKRPKDVEAALPVPLFLTIPARKLRAPLSPARESKPAANSNREGARNSPEALISGLTLPPEGSQELKPYHDALRDRLMNYFDVRDMTHKPKLIAVTSCKDGAGVSSVAGGLAASLSETGDGNVLLVDMRGQRGAARAFYHGKPAIGLAEALESETRGNAQVHENLYVVSAGSTEHKLQKILPQQFSSFVPKLKASDYDYIIFDMPPVGQTSVTAKVARFMDMVLMVVESEKTDRDVARRAGALLAEANATVATVLNKHRRYVPAWLHQELP